MSPHSSAPTSSPVPARDLVALRATLAAVLASVGGDGALDTALQHALQLTGARSGSLWLRGAEGRPERVRQIGLPPEYIACFERDGDLDIQAALMEAREPFHLRPGTTLESPPDGTLILAAPGVLHLCMVPLTIGEQSLGLLTLGFEDPAEGERFSREFLGMLGDVIAAAIGHTRLLAERRQAVAELSAARALEERLRHTQKMEAVGTLAGGIAHEYNNLLTAILGNLALALHDLPSSHPLVPGLRDAHAAADRAAELTRQLLGFGRRGHLHLRPVDLHEVVSGALPLLRRTFDPRILIVHTTDPGPAPVHADAAQLSQVVVNLCLNARDAMPAGGELHLHTGPARGTEDAVVLQVRDRGEGMAPEILTRIYEPFFTTKSPERGTGLGLAVVHSIVEQHGGWIECESTPGEGTEFRVSLPRLQPEDSLRDAPMGRGERILVVDDEPALRGLARSVLERLGYRVEEAADGEAALDRLAGAGPRVELVLLDQTMPRLGGGDTLRRIRGTAGGVAVVLTSGYAAGYGPEAALAGQADAFLAKPWTHEALARVVREALDSRVRVADNPPRPGPPSA